MGGYKELDYMLKELEGEISVVIDLCVKQAEGLAVVAESYTGLLNFLYEKEKEG